MQGMRMQTAEQILQAMRKLGEKRLPLVRVYRSLFSEELFLAAYDKIRQNDGVLTPGIDDDTVDGMSLQRIRQLIDDLRCERFRFRPARRIQIPKKSGGTRPLSVPSFTDKLVQEALRMLLEAYYEPRFRQSSHGFRPHRGCHTALQQVKQEFKGVAWFIEGDIRGCFDNIDHDILMALLSRDIQDGRLLNLIRMALQAGYLEDWQYHKTFSGTPQGGVLSPLLSNIYLHELDVFIEDNLIPRYTRGEKRRLNSEYTRIRSRLKRARERKDTVKMHEYEQIMRTLPTLDTHDPDYRRLHYIRYADDFLLGFAGSKSEAEDIKQEIGAFLGTRLKLEMSDPKTLITHARSQHAKFLGYAISIYHADDCQSLTTNGTQKRRAINGKVRLGIPYGWVGEQCKRYQRNGKPIHEAALLSFSDAHILDVYQRRYRGIAEYYKYAVDRCHLSKLKYVMETALAKTLAGKYKLSVRQVFRRYHGRQTIGGKTYKTLQVEVPTRNGSRIIYWGAIPLSTEKIGYSSIRDLIPLEWTMVRTDLIKRLQANTCELCGSHDRCEVHHIRKLSDLKHRWAGKTDKPQWVIRMIAMQRKTLVVCFQCHRDIHAGRITAKLRT